MDKGIVVVTGIKEEIPTLALRAAQLGYETIALPTIRLEKRALSARALSAIKKIDSYDYVIFTSAHAASFFAELLKELRLRKPSSIRIVAVGSATASACRSIGFKPHSIAKEFNARAMISGIRDLKGRRILFPRSLIGSLEPIRLLRSKGALVTVIPLYTSIPLVISLAARALIFEKDIAAIVFMSPSSLTGFAKNLNKTILRRPMLTALCIGPTTGRAAYASGFRNIAIAQPSTTAGIIKALRQRTLRAWLRTVPPPYAS